MTDSERILEIEQTQSLAKARALVEESESGFEEALFSRLREQLGADIEKALWVAKSGERLGGERETWGHRFKSVRLRSEMRWVASANASLRAEETNSDAVEGAAMAVGAVDALARAGRISSAVELGERLFKILDKAGKALNAGRAALNTGNALLWGDRVTEAIHWLEIASANLTDSPIEHAGAMLGLSTAQIDFGRASDVRKHAETARDAFADLSLEHYANIAEQNVAQAALLNGQFDLALEILLRLRPEFSRGGEDFARTEQFIGETYMRLNMPIEARQALRDALKSKGMRALPVNCAQAWLDIAHAEVMLENYQVAKKAATRSIAEFSKSENAAGATLAKSLILQLDRPADKKLYSDLISMSDRSGLRRNKAELLLQSAEIGRDENLLDQARSVIDEFGLVDLEWRTHFVAANVSEDSDKLSSYRKMAEAIWKIRAVQKSTLSRQYFLQDKDDALRQYLNILLSDGSQDLVLEALDVVGQARSVSLIDEILGAGRPQLDANRIAELERLRAELREATGSDFGNGNVRMGPAVDLDSWQRAWRETEGLTICKSNNRADSHCDLTFIDTGESYHRIANGKADSCGPKHEIEAMMRWLEFDLMEPVVNPKAGSKTAMATAEKFGKTVLDPSRGLTSISPDLGLWGVPWAVITAAVEYENEPVLALSPAFQKTYSGQLGNHSMLIWYQESEDLPHIGDEVAHIVEKFPDARLCQTAEEVRTSLKSGNVDMLHVATHARLNSWNPMFSSLQFNDGQIFASEIASASLRPRLVTMSACETGSVSTINKNEPDGLVRAALALGAESVVASTWSLHDRAASLFMSGYYTQILNGSGVLKAVLEGRNTVRREFSHPYYWGAMVTFGGYQK